MYKYFLEFIKFMRPAFSRQATYDRFVVVLMGFILRNDYLGVTSIIRALFLSPKCYIPLLHFFHSSAWNVLTLMELWWKWLNAQNVGYRVDGRAVLIGDHTMTSKEGRKMPSVTTLHQNSETASKPSFFRGHYWGCIAMLIQKDNKYFAAPLQAAIHEGLEFSSNSHKTQSPKTTLIVEMARQFVLKTALPVYLILDAYFSVGPVFIAASLVLNGIENPIHILTRAKKNIVAFLPPLPKPSSAKGPKNKYGQKLKLMELFNSSSYRLSSATVTLYGKQERIRYLALNLLWKPSKKMLRFILVDSHRGQIILMSSNLQLSPLSAIQLYSHRTPIETLFDVLKNNQGAMQYHFWSKYLSPSHRTPLKNKIQKLSSSSPYKTSLTFDAIEKFVNLHIIVTGILQLIAFFFSVEVKKHSFCWLRTPSVVPSEFVTRSALIHVIKTNLYGFAYDLISLLIRKKQSAPFYNKDFAASI